MANKIKIKRGNKVNLPPLDDGELAYTKDTQELHIGATVGETTTNIHLNPKATKADVENVLTGNITSHTHPNATTGASGYMSSGDKSKLDGIATGAQVNVKPDWNAVSGNVAEILNKPSIDGLLGGLASLGFVKRNGANSYTIDTSTYQPLDADLTAIAAISGTSGLLRKTGTNTWNLDSTVYLTAITKAQVEEVLAGVITTHTHNPAQINTNASNRFVTDTQISTWNNKVDKVAGKGLSTEDYTSAEKTKLSDIQAGAQVNIQSDWNATSGDALILNKPTIPNKVSDLTNDKGYITDYTETDPIFTAWDKSTGISITKSQVSDLIEATQSLSGLMSATDKERLDALHALLEEDTENNVVDSINEILAIFNNYPEGADLVTALAGKVDKVAGKGLSTNDYTTTEKNKLAGIATGAEVNVQSDWNASSGDALILNKPTIPNKVSDLTNDKGYITGYTETDPIFTAWDKSTGISIMKSQVSDFAHDHNNLYYTKDEIDNLPSDVITDVGTFDNSYAVMEHLLVNDLPTGIYKANLEVHGGFEVIINYQRTPTTAKGTVQSFDSLAVVDIDLSGGFPDFVRNDQFDINAETLPYNNSVSGLSATNVGQAIDELEANKVDKVSGKGLSTEDYTTTEKNKLAGIASGAEVNVQSDWNATSGDALILNKPDIPAKVSDLTNDIGYITGYTETDPIFTAWDKSTGISIMKSQVSDLIEATQSLSGLMSATDKTRLDALHALLEEDTANNVVDSINEVLEIFNNYPEGADLVTALAGKVDKVTGKGLSTNDLTNTLKSNYDTAYGWGNHATENYLKSITKAMVEAVLTGTITTHNHDGVYEPSFTKNSAFNKNFGTTAGTVTQGNDSRLSDARPASDVSAWAKKTSLAIEDIPTGTTGSTVALGNHTHSEATTSVAGFLSAADKYKLNTIAEGAQKNVATNLGITKTTTTNTITSSTGNDAVITGATTTQAGLVTTGSQTWNGIKTFNSSPVVPYPTDYNHATNIDYVDSFVNSYVNGVVEDLAPLLIFRDATIGAAVGSGGLLSDLDAGGYTLTSVRTPTAGGDATNKTYVDTVLSNAIADIESEISGVYRPSGNWNAVTNTPAITDPMTEADVGKVFYVETAEEEGTERFGFTWHKGDKLAVIEGGVITKWDNVDDVTSVAGKTGAVVLAAGDIASGTLSVARGGTGASTHTSGNVLIGNGTGAVTSMSRSGIDTRTTFPPSAHTHAWGDITGKPTTFTPSSHTHGKITNDGKIGSTAGLMVKTGTAGAVDVMTAGSTSQYLRGDGTWATPPNSNTTYTAGTNMSLSGTTFSATDTKYTAGDNVTISASNVISATDTNTTYTAGSNIQISAGNVISATNTNTTYALMTDSTLGLGKVYSNTTQSVAANSITSTTSRTYGIQKNSNGQLVVNVPWVNTDTNSTDFRPSNWVPSWDDVTGKPTTFTPSSHSHAWGDVTGKPTTFTPISHSHGKITNDGKIGSTAGLMVKTSTAGAVDVMAAGSNSQYLRGDGTWATPPNSNTTYTAGDGLTLTGTVFTPNTSYTTSGKNYKVQVDGTSKGLYVNVPWTDTNTNTTYSLMTDSTLGLGKVFSNTVQSTAASAVTTTASRTYGIQKNSDGQLVVNVPWVNTNTNTTYTAGTNMSLSGTTFSATDTKYTAGTNIQISDSNVISATNTNTTYTAGSGLSLTGTVFANTAQNATHTGDVTGSTALTIAADSVTNAKLANMAVNTIKGRVTAGTGNPEDLTVAQVQTLLGWSSKQNTLNGTGFVKASGKTISYDNSSYLPSTGGTMTGSVNMGGNSITAIDTVDATTYKTGNAQMKYDTTSKTIKFVFN